MKESLDWLSVAFLIEDEGTRSYSNKELLERCLKLRLQALASSSAAPKTMLNAATAMTKIAVLLPLI